MSDDDAPDERRTEGVRIIGAQEAAEAAGRPDVVRRRRRSEKRYGDRPDAPEPASDLPKITISTTEGEAPRALRRGPLRRPGDPARTRARATRTTRGPSRSTAPTTIPSGPASVTPASSAARTTTPSPSPTSAPSPSAGDVTAAPPSGTSPYEPPSWDRDDEPSAARRLGSRSGRTRTPAADDAPLPVEPGPADSVPGRRARRSATRTTRSCCRTGPSRRPVRCPRS